MLRIGSFSFLLAAFLAFPLCSSAQDNHIPMPSAVPQAQDLHLGMRPTAADLSIAPDEIQRQQAIAANEQRQVEIRRDTEKMQQLVAELKDYLQKVDHGLMSVEAVKKAEQIEKLAHSVKSKMKQTF
jgi:hypothetical protein